MTDHADAIIDLYQRRAASFDVDRGRDLFEKAWLDRFLALVAPDGAILDIGCGCGEPIARYLIESGFRVSGVDSSAAMIELCRSRFPHENWRVADMRSLTLGARFNGILAWDSFFHLRMDDQRKMFPIFRKHAAPGAPLMFTSGPREGVAMGIYHGEPLYHASLEPQEYRALLDENGFEVVRYVAEDASCGGHTIWLAKFK